MFEVDTWIGNLSWGVVYLLTERRFLANPKRRLKLSGVMSIRRRRRGTTTTTTTISLKDTSWYSFNLTIQIVLVWCVAQSNRGRMCDQRLNSQKLIKAFNPSPQIFSEAGIQPKSFINAKYSSKNEGRKESVKDNHNNWYGSHCSKQSLMWCNTARSVNETRKEGNQHEQRVLNIAQKPNRS